MSDQIEEVPLCECGKPRKKGKYYIQATGSDFYKTCGDTQCRNKKQGSRFFKKAKKIKIKTILLTERNNPEAICLNPECNNLVGGGTGESKKQFCSDECRLTFLKKFFGDYDRLRKEKTVYKRKIYSDIYKDIKAGATKSDIRRKYNLNKDYLDSYIAAALMNREREINDKLRSNKES